MATVIFEDIYKRVSTTHSISDKRQAIISKLLCEYFLKHVFSFVDIFLFLAGCIGLLVVFLAFIVSYMKGNIIVVIKQEFLEFK